jgi:hypothetical protein
MPPSFPVSQPASTNLFPQQPPPNFYGPADSEMGRAAAMAAASFLGVESKERRWRRRDGGAQKVAKIMREKPKNGGAAFWGPF